MDTKKVVVCLIRDSKGKFLMIRPSDYKDFGKYQDAWYPPTGHIKKGETVQEALTRELKEELNIRLNLLSCCPSGSKMFQAKKHIGGNAKSLGAKLKKGRK